MKTLKRQQEPTRLEVSQIIAQHESRHRKNTRGVNHALLQHLTNFVGGTLLVSDITEDFCFSFAKFLMSQVATNSARTYLHKLHAILERAVSSHLLDFNPMPTLNELLPRFVSPRRTYLTLQDVERLRSTPCHHNETKRAFLFACQTGLRLSDIETLEWSDIVNINGTPTIVKTQVKTSRQVRIPLNRIALEILGTLKSQGHVFHLMSRSIISIDLHQWAKDAGIGKDITFHVSRHTFATLSISAGVDIYVVSKLCGHATVKTTEIYAHLIDSTLQQGVDKLGIAMRNSRPSAPKSWFRRLLNPANTLIQKLRRQKNLRVGVGG